MNSKLKKKWRRLKKMQEKHDELIFEKHGKGKVFNEEEERFMRRYMALLNECEEESMSDERKESIKKLEELLEKAKHL